MAPLFPFPLASSNRHGANYGSKELLAGIWLLILGSCVLPLRLHAQLSGNSGINASDTYVVFDLTLQPQVNVQLSHTVQTTEGPMSSVTAGLPHPHYHVEMGFDTADQPVMNVTPTDPADDPSAPPETQVGAFKVRNNQVTVFDGNGTPLPLAVVGNAPPQQKLFATGLPTNNSLTQMMVTSDPQNMASMMNGSVTSNDGTHAVVSVPQSGYTQALTYTAQGSNWVLTQMVTTQPSSMGPVSTTVAMANVSWSTNAAGDARRAASSPPAPAEATQSAAALAPLAFPVPTPANVPAFGSTGSQALILQHGLGGDSTSWGDRMLPWLKSDLILDQNHLANFSLTASDPIQSQTNDLNNRLVAAGQPGSSIAIGHSQGGLIIRDLAQRYLGRTSAVITVDTPHQGAWSAAFGSAGAISIGDLLLTSCGTSILDIPTCGLGGIAYLAGVVSFIETPPTNPDVVDITPGSSFLANLNSNSEGFRRLGIISRSNKRWLWIRVIGDGICATHTHTACGQNYYDAAQGVYFLNLARFIADIISGFFFNPWAWIDAGDALAQLLKMEATNVIWDGATGAFGDDSDGLVTGTSQRYPNPSDLNYVIGNADSHSGNLHSGLVRFALDQILQQRFLVPHTGCTYSLSAPASVPFQGGYLPVTVNTGSGCAWAALTSDAYIDQGQILLGGQTTYLHVDINLSQTPRTSTINVQGQTVTFTQQGFPQYAATGRVVVDGYEQPYDGPCDPPNGDISLDPNGNQRPQCPARNIWDSGEIDLTVDGNRYQVWYGQDSTPVSLAQDMAGSLGGEVVGGTIGNIIYVVSLNATPYTNTDYVLSGGSSSTSQYYFSGPSFTVGPETPMLTGNP